MPLGTANGKGLELLPTARFTIKPSFAMERFTGDVAQMRFHYTTQVRIRYGETDAMGYVYYGNYPLFMEVGRNELMRSLGFPYGRMESEGVMMPVVEMYVKYGTPARYDDLLDITTGILDIRGASVVFGYRMTRVVDGVLVVWGSTTLAFVDKEKRTPVRAPRSVLARVEEAIARQK